jgi:hypothetical protein
MSKHKRQPITPIHPNQYDGRYKVEVLKDRHVTSDDKLTGGTAVTDDGRLLQWRLVSMYAIDGGHYSHSGRGKSHVRYFYNGKSVPTEDVESINPGITSSIYRALESVHLPEHCCYWFDDELMADKNGVCALEGEALEKVAHEERLRMAQEAETQYNAWHKEEGQEQ